MRQIAFLTDWGLSSYYVGVTKSVIKQINENVEIIDITHSAGHFNIKKYGCILHRASFDFPTETVFLCVVDPTVGSNRKPIALQTIQNNLFFVGPDNGLFSLVIEEFGLKKAVELSNEKYYYKKRSLTFHGRDIFAPVAAYLSKGITLNEIGKEIEYEDIETFKIKKPEITNNRLIFEYLYSDDFGNIETNLTPKYLSKITSKSFFEVEINGIKKEAFLVNNYSEVGKGDLIIHLDSSGYYEIAVNQGNASKVFNISEDFDGQIKLYL